MPIVGLTDTGIAKPTQIGKLRKGSPKGERGVGVELDHFRFAPEQGWEHTSALFVEAYGDSPRELVVKLPCCYVDENLSSWYFSWSAGGLLRKCDGETCHLHRSTYKENFSTTPEICPLKDNPSTKCPMGCKPTGSLSLILPKLRSPGLVTLETHSYNDLKNLYGSLLDAFEKLGDLRDVPFRLSRRQKEVATPVMGKDKKPTGEKTKRLKWLCFIEIDPDWFSLMLSVHESRRRKLILGGEVAAVIPLALPHAVDNEFKPVNRKDGTNAMRLQSVANALGLTSDAIVNAIDSCYPGKHSSQLTDAHCDRVICSMLVAYAVAKGLPLDVARELSTKADLQGNDLQKTRDWAAIVESGIITAPVAVQPEIVDDEDEIPWDSEPNVTVDEGAF